MADAFETLKAEARACRVCQPFLAHPCRPIVQGTGSARIQIIGQAPGTRVQTSGRPFTDPSGDRLRRWMGVSEQQFYDESLIAITPMGFCFPGLDARGADNPPRKECAPLWQNRARAALPDVALTLLIGAPAQNFHLGARAGKSLTETVLRWRTLWPVFAALPHPSWRNNRWLKVNPWFEKDVLPSLQSRIRELIGSRS